MKHFTKDIQINNIKMLFSQMISEITCNTNSRLIIVHKKVKHYNEFKWLKDNRNCSLKTLYPPNRFKFFLQDTKVNTALGHVIRKLLKPIN